jgi:ABC-type uncharacterized transport system substrate-binding protein
MGRRARHSIVTAARGHRHFKKGAHLAEPAIEQPTRYELVLNRKAATAFGITIPPSMLLRADRVIE